MCRGVQSIVAAEAGWRQIRSKIDGNQRIFKVEEVKAWVIQEGGKATPLASDGNIDSDYRLVEVVSPLCDDSEEVLLERAHSRTLN